MSWNTADNVDPTLQDWGEAYRELCALLKAKVPELKHVDLYYGQDQIVDSDGNWLPFRAPAVFLEFQAPQVNDLGDLCQQMDMDITVWVATETVQDTHHGSAGQRRAMEFVALMRKVHVALHNASGQHFSPLSRVGMQRKADAPPYMYMYGQTYRGVLLDNSTSPQLAYLYPPHQLEIEPVSGDVPGIDPPVGECPTVQQLIPITTVQVIAESLTTQQAADLYVILGGTGGDLATLVGQATPEQLYAVMTPQQVAYVQGLVSDVPLLNSEGTTIGQVPAGAAQYEAPDGTLYATDGTTEVDVVPAGGARSLTKAAMRYIDRNGDEQLANAGPVGFDGDNLIPDFTIPRFTILEPNGLDVHDHRDISDPEFTLPAPPAASGIAYPPSDALWSGMTNSAVAGSEGWARANGYYNDAGTRPTHPASYMRLGNNWMTLAEANKFGNTNRYTNTSGAAYATSGNRRFYDHLWRIEFYIPDTLVAATTWANAMAAALALGVDGGGWIAPPMNWLHKQLNRSLAQPLNWGPFGLAVDLWTSTDRHDDTTGARVFLGASTGTIGNRTKTSTAQLIYARRMAP